MSDILQGCPLKLYFTESPRSPFSLSRQSCRLHKACTNIRGLLACRSEPHRRGWFAQVDKVCISCAQWLRCRSWWVMRVFAGRIEQGICLRHQMPGNKITKGLGDQAAATENRREVGFVSLWRGSTPREHESWCVLCWVRQAACLFSRPPWPTLHRVVDIGLIPGRPKRSLLEPIYSGAHTLLSCRGSAAMPESQPALPEDREKRRMCRSRSIGALFA